jgi:hypothetical protein
MSRKQQKERTEQQASTPLSSTVASTSAATTESDQDIMERRYGSTYMSDSNESYSFSGRGGTIISQESAKVLYNVFVKMIDETQLNVEGAMNLILHKEIIGVYDEEEAAIKEWNAAIKAQDRYAVSTNFVLVMSNADISSIHMGIGQVDSYQPDEVIKNAIKDAYEQVGAFSHAVAMIKSLALKISQMGYSSSVNANFVRENEVAQALFKKWSGVKKPGDNKVTIQRLLDSSIFFRTQSAVDGFLYRKGFSKYWFAGFGFVFLSDSDTYYSILGSSMRNAFLSANRKNQKVSVLALFQSSLRQRVAVCNNKQNILRFNATTNLLVKGQPGGLDVSIVPLSLISFEEFFENDKNHSKAFMEGFCHFGEMTEDQKEVLRLLDGKKKKKRMALDEEEE